MKILLLVFASFFIYSFSSASENCTPLLKTVKYKFKKGDHLPTVLRDAGLDPVFTKIGSLQQLLKINKIQNMSLVQNGQEIVFPFLCEEQLKGLSLVDKEEFRLLVNLKPRPRSENETAEVTGEVSVVPPVDGPSAELLVDPTTGTKVIPVQVENKIQTSDQQLEQILKPDGSTVEQPKDLEMFDPKNDEISEALRYRMICEGEWTGSECITRYSTLFATISGWYNRYEGVDPTVTSNNKGLLLSRLNPQGGIGWHNYWTENVKTELSATMQNSEMLPEARELPIEQDKKLLSSIYLEGRYEFGPYGIGVGLRNYDKLFYRFRFSGLTQPCFSNDSSFAGCGVFVHSANIMSYFVNGSWMFRQAGKFRYDAKFTFSKLAGAATGGFTINEGTAWALDFTVTHDRVREYMYGAVRYGQSAQNTSIEDQTVKELGFIFGYAWKLKDW